MTRRVGIDVRKRRAEPRASRYDSQVTILSTALSARLPERAPRVANLTTTVAPVGRELPDPHVCEQARLSRDARFDGLFFTGVLSTRIYCRPVCPARWANRVVYFSTAAAAEAAGYRPCLRCRPELSPEDGTWRRSDELVARALKIIDQGSLDEESLPALAARVGVGERQLRRLFVERLGAPPIAVRRTRRLLFAKQLLTETRLPITQVALAAGFGSLRRFNAAFRDAYRMAPSALRRQPGAACEEMLTLRLAYRPPFDLASTLEFLRARALPGVEVVDALGYSRVISPEPGDSLNGPAWLHISAWPNDAHAMKLEVHGTAPTRLLGIIDRLRRMFDLDADPQRIEQALSVCDTLRPLVRCRPGLRIPGGWDGFEIAVRAVIGHRMRASVAQSLTARLTERYGTPLAVSPAPGLDRLFPPPHGLADADLASIGLPLPRAHTVRSMARAMLDGRVDFSPERTLGEFVERWTSLPGINVWMAHYLALRALGHPDAFPIDDAVFAYRPEPNRTRPGSETVMAAAESWRPWRGYAAIHLWRVAGAA